jgi:hypothetical protein
MKAHKETPVYNVTNDDMDWIGYHVRDFIEEAIEEATKKQEEMNKQV